MKHCRFCQASALSSFCDLGTSPLSNAYLDAEALMRMEPFYPLHAYVCEECFLVQLDEFEQPDNIFGDYAYFSSYSTSWLEHAQRYVNDVIDRYSLTKDHQVVEIASNDGYLLQYFMQKDIPVLGIEPAKNVAEVANNKGIPTRPIFFGSSVARELDNEGIKADLLLGNNVLAHVPDLNDFVKGLKILLKDDGVITMEFPHLYQLILNNQFDTIYHEHFSYFSLYTVINIFSQHGLTIFHVDELSSHGGSLRIHACHDQNHKPDLSVDELLAKEIDFGLNNSKVYREFSEQVKKIKRSLLSFLITQKEQGKNVVAYGAPAKGNTLLNYCGIYTDLISYTVDVSPHKYGKYLPGTHVPIYHTDMLAETRPDYVLILPWNIKDEIIEKLSYLKTSGTRFVLPIPELTILQ